MIRILFVLLYSLSLSADSGSVIFDAQDTGWNNPIRDPNMIASILDDMDLRCLIKPSREPMVYGNLKIGHKIIGIRIHVFEDSPSHRQVDLIFDRFLYDGVLRYDNGPGTACCLNPADCDQ